jgi:excisionase family DNA binding protein
METEVRLIISPVGPIYTTEETASLMKVSVRTVQRLIRARQLRSRKVGRIYRILGKDIEQFFAAQDTPTNTPCSNREHQ